MRCRHRGHADGSRRTRGSKGLRSLAGLHQPYQLRRVTLQLRRRRLRDPQQRGLVQLRVPVRGHGDLLAWGAVGVPLVPVRGSVVRQVARNTQHTWPGAKRRIVVPEPHRSHTWSPAQRAALVSVATADIALRAWALWDLARRPRAEVNGPKVAWALALAAVSSAGVLPAVYLVVGRRRPHVVRPASTVTR